MRWPSRIRVWCRTRVCRSAASGQVSAAHAFARRSRREGADLLAEAGGGGDQDRGQGGAGGLAGLDGVVPVDHQQPQGLPVPVGAHLRGRRAGQQLAGRADGVDRVALARPALPDVPAAVDLGDLLALRRPGGGPGPARSAGFLPRPR